MRKPAIAVLLLLAVPAACPAAAQEDGVSVSARVTHERITEEDFVQLVITVSARREPGTVDVRLPALSEFERLGEQTGRRESWVNGVVSLEYNYIYVLHPRRTGRLTIPPIPVEVGGRLFRTEPITITVTEGSLRDDIVLRLSADRESVYVGQQFALTTELYFRRVRVTNYDVTETPETEGFVVVEEPLERAPISEVEFRGLIYHRLTLRVQVLFPLSAGIKEIGPLGLRLQFREDPFGGRTGIAHRSTNALRIEVKPLPEAGRPPGFAGAVGDYDLRWSIGSTGGGGGGRAGEPLRLTVELSGDGDIERAPEAALPVPRGFELVGGGGGEHSAELRGGVWGGAKAWEYVLIPGRPGEATLGPLEYPYFDPRRETYLVARADPIALAIEPAEPQVAAERPPPVEAVEGEEDIRYIRTSTGALADRGRPLLDSYLFWLLLALPPACNLLLYAGALVLRRGRTGVGTGWHRRALKPALRCLRRAASLAGRRPDAGRVELKGAVFGYLAEKLGLHPAGLSMEEVRAALLRRDLHDSRAIGELEGVLEACDAPRYAPSDAGGATTAELCERAARALAELDGAL